MPDADGVARAIASCDFVAVSDIRPDTDTARLAHVLLPATGWGEKDGTVTDSERMISRQRGALPAPGQARPDWWQIAQVARRMGFQGFDWSGPAQIFAEHAALSGIAGGLGSDFDISDMGARDYETLAPTRWPQGPAQRGERFFGTGRFHTPDGRARMVPVAAALPARIPGKLTLNTGRTRDQWHTMTRTGLSPRLSRHLAEPYLEIHPDDMTLSDAGRGLFRAALSDEQGLVAALFVSDQPVRLSRAHLGDSLTRFDPAILAGHPGEAAPDRGAILCACFEIGVNTITRAIARDGLLSVEAIGAALGAGTNCGSCRPELRALLARATPIAAE